MPAPADSEPPTFSMASANCAALRVPAPCWIRSVNSDAVPSLPAGSPSPPPRTVTFIDTSGVSRFSTRATTAPLGSVASL